MAAPMLDLHPNLNASMMPYGPALADGSVLEIPAHFDAFEAEYGAIRQRVGVMHLPQRGLLECTGPDAKDFLQRMLTQEISKLSNGQNVRSFQLNERGQIIADLMVHHRDEATWLEGEVFDLPAVASLYDARLFTEELTIDDRSDAHTCFALLGPAAARLLDAVSDDDARAVASTPAAHHVLRIDELACRAYRRDVGRVLAVHLTVPRDGAARVHKKLLDAAGYEAGQAPDADFAQRRRGSMRGRPVGWSAFNSVRIEEGMPLYHVDFGTDSLPAETSQLDAAVSFVKGCYLGQEVVARMKSLGHPKKLLVGLAFDHADLPVAGAQIFEPGHKQKVIGGVTSSTLSPLKGQQAIAFAVLRWGRHQPGTEIRVAAEGQLVSGHVAALDALVHG